MVFSSKVAVRLSKRLVPWIVLSLTKQEHSHKAGAPQVTDHKLFGIQNDKLVLGLVKTLEENSSHPIARALASFCSQQEHETLTLVDVDEVPGKGLKGTFRVHGKDITAIIGNEKLMADYQVQFSGEARNLFTDLEISWRVNRINLAAAIL